MAIRSVSCAARSGFIIYATLLFVLCQSSAWGGQGKTAVYIDPYAALNADGTGPGTSHSRAILDFGILMEEFSQKHHVNTVILNLDSTSYKWEFDPTLRDMYYAPARGFTKAEIRAMVTHARNWGMNVYVALATITHQNSQGQLLSRAYPQFMLPEPAWQSGKEYTIYSFVEMNGVAYSSKAGHTSAASNEPGSGANWEDYWQVSPRHLRDPYNAAGDAKFFGMIDDAIDAATVDGVKPDGVHLCGDEGVYFSDTIVLQDGDTVAGAYAKGFINAYNHIKSNHPGMKVVMWGDMLDKNFGETWGTSDAIDLIPKDIIIGDWRYQKNAWYGYDSVKDEFPSVRIFAEKGFTVWPCHWKFEDAARSLVKTANTVSNEGGAIYGHIYASFYVTAIAELKNALDGTGSPSQEIIDCANSLENSIRDIEVSTVYENAEDGNTDGWLNYSAAGTFANVYDSERGNRVIQFSGDGLNSFYRLNHTGTWSASGDLQSTQFVFEWSHKYSEDFGIYLDVNTSAGQRFIYYTAADTDYLGTGQYVHHGLGPASRNGAWQTFERDVEADFHEAQPGASLYKINNIIVAGSGRVDDIKLISGDTIYEDAENGNTDGWLNYSAAGTFANVYDSGRGNRVIQFSGDGLNSFYRLNHTGTWSASGDLQSTQFVFEWSHKYSEDFGIYLDVNTSAGQRFIYYTAADTDYLGTGQYVHHGLGPASKDGTWQTFERDVKADFQEAQPGEVLYEINNFTVSGSGCVDDLKLRKNPKFVAHWRFDEGSGYSVAAANPYTNITGATSNTSWVNGVDGQSAHALSFNGSTSYINIPSNSLFAVSDDGITFSAWIKPNSLSSSYNMALSHGSGHYLSLYNGYVCLKIITGGVPHWAWSSSPLTVNAWSHIAGSYDRGGNLKVFINGRQNGNTAGPFFNPDHNTNSLIIGKYADYSQYYFNGIIDDVQICRRGCTAREIRKLKDSAIIAYSLALSEGTGIVAYDNFDRSRQATIAGATWQGKALYFDGVNDYVTLAGSDSAFRTDGSNGFTLAAWIKSDGAFPAEHDGVLLKGNTYLSIYAGKLRFKTLTDFPANTQRVCVGSTTLTPSAWHHVAAVYDANGNMKVYLDGAQDGITVGPYPNQVNEPDTVLLGRTWFQYFKGNIRNARIYKRGLTTDEISLLYQNEE